MSTPAPAAPKVPAPRAYYSARAAAKYLGMGEETIRRALRCTDPNAYPPPLDYDGRHGEGGKYHIPHDALVAWSKSLSRFG